MKEKFSFKVDCVEMDVEGISLCDKKVHVGDKFHLSLKLGADVSINQLKEILKVQELDDEQFWLLELTPLEGDGK